MAKAKESGKKTAAKKAAPKKESSKAVAKKAEAKPKKEAPKKAAAPVEAEAAPAPEKVKKEKAPKPPKEPKAPKAPRMTKAQVASDKLAAEDAKKWIDLKEKYSGEKAATYSMSSVYEANKPLQHKVLGWGYILNVQNDRLEVLFENGPKMLISNYKTK